MFNRWHLSEFKLFFTVKFLYANLKVIRLLNKLAQTANEVNEKRFLAHHLKTSRMI